MYLVEVVHDTMNKMEVRIFHYVEVIGVCDDISFLPATVSINLNEKISKLLIEYIEKRKFFKLDNELEI